MGHQGFCCVNIYFNNLLISDLADEAVAMVIQEFPGCYHIQCPIHDFIFLFNV